MDCVLVKTEAGLEGLGERQKRAYDRWREMAKRLEIGETIRFSWKEPRNRKFHALFFVFIGKLFDMQEQFEDDKRLREWLTTGAGFADYAPGPTGRMVAFPKSIAFENMDETEFAPLVAGVWAFLRTEHAQQFLWPMVPAALRSASVETLLAQFDTTT